MDSPIAFANGGGTALPTCLCHKFDAEHVEARFVKAERQAARTAAEIERLHSFYSSFRTSITPFLQSDAMMSFTS